MILESREVEAFRFPIEPQWTTYSEIVEAFRSHESASNITPVPEQVIAAGAKLIIRDSDTPLRSFVTAERLYPKRAWVGRLGAGWGTETAFAVAGILNSAVGYVLYQERAAELGAKSHDLSKKALAALPIPLPAGQETLFSSVALVSYRLHVLHEAQQRCRLDLESSIRNHRLRLLSDVVQLYGWTEEEARTILRNARERGLEDIPGYQDSLFFTLRSPLLSVDLLSDEDRGRYEEVKRRVREEGPRSAARSDLERFNQILYWNSRINSPVPRTLTASEWRGISNEREALKAAYRHLSWHRGQRFGAENPVRLSERFWRVDVFYSPPRALSPQDRRRLPSGWDRPGKHPAGELLLDAFTGEVREPTAVEDALAPRS
jgi:hypothetical protein